MKLYGIWSYIYFLNCFIALLYLCVIIWKLEVVLTTLQQYRTSGKFYYIHITKKMHAQQKDNNNWPIDECSLTIIIPSSFTLALSQLLCRSNNPLFTGRRRHSATPKSSHTITHIRYHYDTRYARFSVMIRHRIHVLHYVYMYDLPILVRYNDRIRLNDFPFFSRIEDVWL